MHDKETRIVTHKESDKIVPGASANEAQKKESYYAREIT